MPEEASTLLVALGAGLLVGVERERRSTDDKTPAAAGVRTFAIAALLGALVALSNSWILLVAGALGSAVRRLESNYQVPISNTGSGLLLLETAA